MPKTSLPFSVPIKPLAFPEAFDAADVREAPEPPSVPPKFRKEVSAMFFRLLASFTRDNAVHQARLDQCWNSPHRYLMAHNTWSVK